MKKLILTEEEKNKILNLHGLLVEGECGGGGYFESPSLEEVEKNNKEIEFREKGDAVREIQRLLLKYDYDLGSCGVDGAYGPRTRNAVEEFQKNNDLEVTSSVNKLTLEKLRSSSPIKNIKKTEDKKDSNSITHNDYVIVKSDSYTGNDVHVFFGGAHSIKGGHANIPYLNKVAKIVEPHSHEVTIVLTHHANTLENVREFVRKELDGEIVSIAGFSQGGKETWKHATDGSLRLVGLIDPSTYDINLSMGSNTYMVANPSNWGGKPFVDAVKKRLEWYCDHKDNSKYSGKIDCPKISHWGFLKYFYDKFGSRI